MVYLRKLGPVVVFSCNLAQFMAILYRFALVVCLLLFSYIKQRKGGNCVQS